MLLIGSKNNVNAVELLLNANLLWSVRKEGLKTESGILAPDHVAIVREDTSDILGVHKSGYTPLQNQQMAEILLELSHKADLPIHSAGSFKKGARVFLQLKTDGMNLNGDRVQGFLTALNSYDGSVSLSFGNSTVTISCMNTFFMAYRQMDTKIKHTASMQVRIDALLRSVDEFRRDEQDHFATIRRMASMPMTNVAVDSVFKTIFGTTFAQAEADSREADSKKRVNSTRTLNNIGKFNTALVGETAQKGQNLWGLFSGVTKYTTHLLGDTEESKMMGSIAGKERTLFAQLADLAEPVRSN